jgi:hypothetical protein
VRRQSFVEQFVPAGARRASYRDSGQFPIGTGPKPSRDERDRLILWIDGGLPE